MKKVFAVIVTYNAERWITHCIESVKLSNYKLYPVIVDNASTDNTMSLLKAFEDIKVISLSYNAGFGKANNIGIKFALEAEADYVFLLNQDAYITPTTIETLVEQAESKPEYGILSPVHLNGNGTALDFNFSKYISPKACPNFISDTFFSTQEEIYPCSFINAAAWLLSRDFLLNIGGFSSYFFIYCEDDNILQRMHYHGYKLGLVTRALIMHDREERKGELNKVGQAYYIDSTSKKFLLDIRKSLPEAYYYYAKFAFSTFKKKRNFRTVLQLAKINFSLPQFIKSRKLAKQRGTFDWLKLEGRI